MAKPRLGSLKPFNTIGVDETAGVFTALRSGAPLSGYIGGDHRAGYWVEKLSDDWKRTFGVPHAIPCNSATSGLMAACMAAGVSVGDEVWTTPYSMSATAACALVLGATVRFIDIDDKRFGINPDLLTKERSRPQAVIVTNLFGHAAKLFEIRSWCDRNSVVMIEDNAQSPFALCGGVPPGSVLTGTIGHIGVFSLNVHKHIQCGEGGVIVTRDTQIAMGLEGAINHGELNPKYPHIGLNLRMTEPIAAIACAQLEKAKDIIEGRRAIGLELCDIVKDVPWIKAHVDQPGCKHVYYLWTALVDTKARRGELVVRLNEAGVPIRGGYAPLLHRLFKSVDICPVVEDVDSRIIVFEVCAFDVGRPELAAIRDIFSQVTGEMDAIAA